MPESFACFWYEQNREYATNFKTIPYFAVRHHTLSNGANCYMGVLISDQARLNEPNEILILERFDFLPNCFWNRP